MRRVGQERGTITLGKLLADAAPGCSHGDAWKEVSIVVSVTRLRLRSVLYLPGFLFYATASRREMERVQGFVDGRLIADAKLTFWTITRWRAEDEMRAWRGTGAHGRSMPKLAGWCDEASVARWEVGEDAEFPDWPECYKRLCHSGRFTPVNRPSRAQSAGVIREPDFGRIRQSLWFKPKVAR